MAQAAPSALINSARNALGNVVFFTRKGRTFTRPRVTPSNTITPARTRVRQQMATISNAWKNTLTEPQRQAWRIAGPTAALNPHLQNRGPLTGWNYFQQANQVRLALGLTLLAAPPAQTSQDPAATFSVAQLDATAPRILLDVSGAAGGDTYLIVYATTNRPAGQFTTAGTTRQIATFAPGAARPLDVTAAWVNKFGPLSAGSRVNFQIATAIGSTGQLTARLAASALVTGESDAMQLIQGITLTTDQPTVSFTAIPQTFRHLWLLITARCTGTGVNGSDQLDANLNGDTGPNYDRVFQYAGGFNTAAVAVAQTKAQIALLTDNTADANRFDTASALIPNYSSTAFWKTIMSNVTAFPLAGNPGVDWLGSTTHQWRSLTAITQIDLKPDTGISFLTGSTFSLYGIA